MKDVKELRKAVGMKQCDLAQKLGIGQSNYSNMENGKMITNKLEEIKRRAFDVLLPLLEEKVQTKQQELYSLWEILTSHQSNRAIMDIYEADRKTIQNKATNKFNQI